MSLSLVTAPSAEPFPDTSLPRQQLRLFGTAHDAWLLAIGIPTARERAEQETGRQLITAVWELSLHAFPALIELPRPPLQSVTWVKYVDLDGTLQTLDPSAYEVKAYAGPACRRGLVAPAYGREWPSTRDQVGAVTVRFVAGYGDAGTAVPARLKTAMLEHIGGMFLYREELQGAGVVEVPTSAGRVYRAYKSRPRYPLPGDVN